MLLITLVGLTVLMFWYQRKGKPINIRKLAALDSIEEAVGRATEMGRPVHFTTGTNATLYSDQAPQILAGLSVLRYISSLTAKNNTPLIVTICHPSTIPLVEEILRESYVKAGHADDYRADMVRYISAEQQAYVAGVQGIFLREKVACNIMIGPAYAETLMLLETGFRIGAMQIGGTGSNTSQMPFLVALCDFTLLGEEIYAAGAYITKEPGSLGTILVSDLSKFAMLACLIAGAIITLFSNTFVSLLKV